MQKRLGFAQEGPSLGAETWPRSGRPDSTPQAEEIDSLRFGEWRGMPNTHTLCGVQRSTRRLGAPSFGTRQQEVP